MTLYLPLLQLLHYLGMRNHAVTASAVRCTVIHQVEGRVRMFAKQVPWNAPERSGVEYLRKDDSCLDRQGPCGFLNVDFTTIDWSDDVGATQVIPGSHLWPLDRLPALGEEDRATRHSTLAGLPAGCAVRENF
jgi:ectoine hydroxylase-related dioxygenase (phytanoyl-CoA dioxygenase family)|eukprot:COSAG06_NODE_5635_length_3346_cov_10.017555_2_plen_133_part_00